MDEVQPIKATGMVVVSPAAGILEPQKLIKQDWKALWKRALQEIYVLAGIYLTAVTARISIEVLSKTFNLGNIGEYLTLGQVEIGTMILYVGNRIKDYVLYATKETRYKFEGK